MSEINITESAQDYLKELLLKQDNTQGIKIFVSDAGSPKAETCIAYAKEDDQLEDFEEKQLNGLKIFLEARSLKFIEDAVVDYSSDRFGGTLTIKAPNSKVPQVTEDASLEDKINYILYSEINPSLAAHVVEHDDGVQGVWIEIGKARGWRFDIELWSNNIVKLYFTFNGAVHAQ